MGKYHRRDRIDAKIAKNVKSIPGPLDTDCLIWQGADSGNGRGGGYPRMSLDGATVAVHRVVWVNHNGYIPPKKQIDHRCKNRMCVNEEHLQMVTHRKNQKLKGKNGKRNYASL